MSKHNPTPVPFDLEKANKIINMLSEGYSQKDISAAVSVPWRTVANWCVRYEDFNKLVSQARDLGHDVLADKILSAHEDITDSFKARLFSDNAKWVLARRASAKYGDRLEVVSHQTVNITKALEDAKSRIIDITPREGQGTLQVTEESLLSGQPEANVLLDFEIEGVKRRVEQSASEAYDSTRELALMELLK